MEQRQFPEGAKSPRRRRRLFTIAFDLALDLDLDLILFRLAGDEEA